MKLSDLGEAIDLRRNLALLKILQDKTTNMAMRFDGCLSIDGDMLKIPHAEVDRLLNLREAELAAIAERLGIEVDE